MVIGRIEFRGRREGGRVERIGRLRRKVSEVEWGWRVCLWVVFVVRGFWRVGRGYLDGRYGVNRGRVDRES